MQGEKRNQHRGREQKSVTFAMARFTGKQIDYVSQHGFYDGKALAYAFRRTG